MTTKAYSVDILSDKVISNESVNIKNKKNNKRVSMDSYFINYLKKETKNLVHISHSGIAAMLLPGGTTAHSRFRLPINVNSCNKQRDGKNENVIIKKDNKKKNINIKINVNDSNLKNNGIIDFDDYDESSNFVNKNQHESQSQSDDEDNDFIVDDISIVNSDEDYEVNSSSEEISSSVSSSDLSSSLVDIYQEVNDLK